MDGKRFDVILKQLFVVQPQETITKNYKRHKVISLIRAKIRFTSHTFPTAFTVSIVSMCVSVGQDILALL